MRTGVICYVKTDVDLKDLDRVKNTLKMVFPDAEYVELALAPDSEEDMWQAWWRSPPKA